jgi:Pentapeptide repeats (8 copies)
MPETVQKPIRKVQASGDIILAYHPILAKRQPQTSQRDYLLQLLKDEKINEFNEIRGKNYSSRLDYCELDPSGKNLSHAQLINFDLTSANLNGATLLGAVLKQSRLLKADLKDSNLSNTNLFHANLSNTNLSFSIMIGLRFIVDNKEDYPLCKDALLHEAIIGDEHTATHFRNGGIRDVPPTVKDKTELLDKLKKEDWIDKLLIMITCPFFMGNIALNGMSIFKAIVD